MGRQKAQPLRSKEESEEGEGLREKMDPCVLSAPHKLEPQWVALVEKWRETWKASRAAPTPCLEFWEEPAAQDGRTLA